ncbi:MAG: UDP-N-acetylmuramoyl-L-alanyl-D-glutamate--2,6-diaminopimelate ligase [Clostridiaceae bacterium]|nr:UDP-N-acetylmuramoyl-L-alanyl-D-glutamate--2,6-diaminopimelate ligase [Clostridiaceae bacterium]
MLLRDLLRGVPYRACTGEDTLEITELCFDSRVCKPGMAFAAVRGVAADGHQYIDAAVRAGASLVIAKYPVEGTPTVVTDDPEATLAGMAANFYGNPARDMTMIGVTGTKGKTSTTYFIKAILDREPDVKCGLIGTVCNMAGDEYLGEAHNSTPTVTELHCLLADMRARGCTHVVMEVSSHALALGRVDGIRYRVGVFTNLSQDHLDFHGTMENYLAAKCRLFGLTEEGVVNIDDPASAAVLQSAPCPMHTYSMREDSGANMTARDAKQREADGVDFHVRVGGEEREVRFPVPGLFSVYNAMAALAVAHVLGISLTEAVEALERTHGVPGRAEVVRVDAPFRVIVDYAHSPDSVEKIVDTVAGFTVGRVISVLGCGGNRDRTKRPKMTAAAARGSDYVIVTTDNPRFEEPEDILRDMLPGFEHEGCPYQVILDRRAAIHAALSMAEARDTVLIMGKGHEPYQEVRGVRHHFDDREEAIAYFKGKA